MGYFNLLLSAILLIQIQGLFGEYDLVSKNEVLCQFEPVLSRNWYCQTDEKYHILTDPAEKLTQEEWVPFITQPGRLISRETGPRIGKFNNLNNFNFLLYNSAVKSITQAAYATPIMDVSGDSVCFTFHYNMYGAEMGSVYVTTDFTTFNTFQRIDENEVKTTETNGRREILLARGNQGDVWKDGSFKINLNGRTKVQIGLHVIKGNAVNLLSDVAFDNVKVSNDGNTCGSPAVNGNWGEWTGFGSCSVTCASGQRTATRTCNSPSPSNGGQACLVTGSSTSRALTESKNEVCNTNTPCPGGAINGNWGQWGAATDCSVTCGTGGVQRRFRGCDSPAPLNGGALCAMSSGTGVGMLDTKTEPCANSPACPPRPGEGNWGAWGSASPCSATCGDGKRSRVRRCNNPPPPPGASFCLLTESTRRGLIETKLETCSTGTSCQVSTATDGNWGQWSAYGACSVTCGAGIHSATRICNAPTPTNGGKACLLTGSSTNRALTESKSDACNTNVACPSAGNWGQWGSPTGCTKTCGSGTRTLTRRCDSPVPVNGGLPCALTGSNTPAMVESKTETCNTAPCAPAKTDGAWGEWANTTECSKTCGTGTRTMRRRCDNPAPANNGSECALTGTQTLALVETKDEPCNTAPCAPAKTDGAWGEWANTTECSKTCGTGTRTMRRRCDNPTPANNGSECALTGTQTLALVETKNEPCSVRPCSGNFHVVVNGNWGVWAPLTQCSVTCGTGQRSEQRHCNNPQPQNGGVLCKLSFSSTTARSETRVTACNTNRNCQSTAVNGNWGAWTNTQPCSVTCGYGTRTRTRSCNSPAPSNGGQLCLQINGQRASTETLQQSCKERDCPATVGVDGNWGSWRTSSCSVTCGSGTRSRIRYCNEPSPSNGGRLCLTANGQRATNELSQQSCREQDCAVTPVASNGNWGQWTTSACSVTCGYGTRSRTRFCNSPAPGNGGQLCLMANGQRNAIETSQQSCKERDCISVTNGNWGSWEGLSACSASCGPGTQSRVRYCNNPHPQNGGLSCLLTNGMRATRDTQTSSCQLRQCVQVMDGNWGAWATSSCTTTCGYGTKTRERYCDNPTPTSGGQYCLLSNGQRARTETKQESCKERECVVTPTVINGNWGPWEGLSSCSASCGLGTQTKSRYCNSPNPENGGLACLLSNGMRATRETLTSSCQLRQCLQVVNGNWGPWEGQSACSASCGPGTRSRMRYCNSPVPQNGGLACTLSNGMRATRETLTTSCQLRQCVQVINGNWGPWEGLTACSASCGAGTQSKSRYCNSPSPLNGGLACTLSNGMRATRETLTSSCQLRQCVQVINGNWGQWGGQSACSASCGQGTQSRMRYCNSPSPSNGGLACTLSNGMRATRETLTTACQLRQCVQVIHGNWGQWGGQSACSASCGQGTQSRMRYCNSPSPSNGGLACTLSNGMRAARETLTTACQLRQCVQVINGNWGPWEGLSACSASCGQGTQSKSRYCNSPSPLNGGLACTLPNGMRATRETLTTACQLRQCVQVINGNWGQWEGLSTCSASCGTGTQSRMRYCNSPAPRNGGQACKLSNGMWATRETLTSSCQLRQCVQVINGNWGPWEGQSTCSVSCGTGTQSRMRYCNSPSPSNGGLACTLSNGMRATREILTSSCQLRACIKVINGNWGSWGGLSTCSVSCGTGTQSRMRYCNNPVPSNGGLSCMLSNGMRATRETLTSSCQMRQCVQVINGNWGSWGGQSTCSASCGPGTQSRIRFCNNPSPSNGGLDCILSNGMRANRETLTTSCQLRQCVQVINGNWGSWGGQSTCSASCGPGTQSRIRFCNNPSPSNGGLDCILSNGMRANRETLTSSCQLRQCVQVINGNWGSWGGQSTCSASCGPGTQSRIRFCNNPSPSNGGLDCILSNGMRANRETLTSSCQLRACVQVINGNWGSWGGQSACSASCGPGTQSRMRFCNNPSPSNGGLGCRLSNGMTATRETLTSSCQLRTCLPVGVNGNWGEWRSSGCSVSCGQGTRSQVRYCNNPSPSNGGLQCLMANGMRASSERLQQSCRERDCVIVNVIQGNWGPWSQASACSVTCGSGILNHVRQCNSPSPSNGGLACTLTNSQSRAMSETKAESCTLQSCPSNPGGNGNWGQWRTIIACSVTCGTGSRTKERNCDSPAPTGNGLACSRVNGERVLQERLVEPCQAAPCPSTCAQTSCHSNARCQETNGVAQCVCINGFTGTGLQCSDVNECLNTNICFSGSTCENTIGSYRCKCSIGYQEATNTNGEKTCQDVNECHHNPHQTCPNAACLNTPGSYMCLCKPGFTAVRKNVCQDINECTSGTHSCHLHATCANTPGSYTCKCNDGYRGDGKSCVAGGVWNDWSQWGSCSKTCNFGIKHRHRTCTRQDLAGCAGPTTETTNCFDQLCAQLGAWNQWGAWSTCTGSCGPGQKSRERLCDQPLSCGNGVAKETTTCNDGCRMATCPDNRNSRLRCDFESDCGFLLANPNQNQEVWIVGKKTPTENTGPNGDHTFGSGCGHFVYFEASHIAKGHESYMVSPVIAAHPQTKYCLSFYLSMYSPIATEMGALSVHTWQGNDVSSVWHHAGVMTYNMSHWRLINVDLTVLSNTPFAVLFKGIRGDGFHSDMALDDIQVMENFCIGPVDGNWANWGNFEACSVTCGIGSRQKTRACISPPPRNGGLQCIGENTKTEKCDMGYCPINGNWAQWSAWGSCSHTCGGGQSVRTRECSDPAPIGKGSKCARKDGSISTTEVERKMCSQNMCPRDGNWGQWSNYGACSVSCGEGMRSRTRFCNNPIATGDGKKCLVSTLGGVPIRRNFQTESVPCTLASCPVNGNWGAWGDWLKCSATCGTGQEIRTRTCSNPIPLNGGRSCPGAFSESRVCNVAPCIANGTWGQWAQWAACSRSCGGGSRSRIRQCLNLGANQNSVCKRADGVMDRFETGLGYCNTFLCDRDGNWGLWSSYSTCSVTCGNGFQTRSRLCNDSPAIGNGKNCQMMAGGTGKQESQQQRCYLTGCPVNGNWGAWATSIACNVTCGNGHATKTRRCDNPSPSAGGLPCKASQGNNVALTESRIVPCNNGICSVNGNWGQWSVIVGCSVTCGTGVQTKSRLCNNPTASSQGMWCLLSDGSGQRDSRETKIETCTQNLCAVQGNWGPWSISNTCTVTCGTGTQTRVRHCNNPTPANGGMSCTTTSGSRSSKEENTQSCTRVACPVHGNWGGWNESSACSVTCGEGIVSKSRVCNNPAPSNGGLSCDMSDRSGRRDLRETVRSSCSLSACPLNGNWGRWTSLTACSVTCGNGRQTKIRHCNSPTPSGNGLHCLLVSATNQRATTERVVVACSRGDCPINGNWGQWALHSDCSATCGSGIRTMHRQCNSPGASNGGLWCQTLIGHRDSKESRTEACAQTPCPLDGNWGPWRTDACNVTCGAGFQTRTRFCNSPAPLTGGQMCKVTGVDRLADRESLVLPCNRGACPTNGNWGLWSVTGCSVTCGTGVQTKIRSCNSPAPSNGGLSCLIPNGNGERDVRQTVVQTCSLNACPTNGNWGQWTVSQPCNVTCGTGYQTKIRRCNSPVPTAGGLHCKLTGTDQHADTESIRTTCNRGLCPVNGNWGQWASSACSVTCGMGTVTRTRLCNSPSASNGGLACLLSSGTGHRDTRETIAESCSSNACAINGNWGMWSIAEPCDVTCGDGFQKKTRLCNNPSASNGGANCLLTNSQQRATREDIRAQCSRTRCPLDGNWGAWTTTSSCSVTCGTGRTTKTRACNNPSAQYGGLWCMLSDGSGNRDARETVSESCTLAACPVNGNWGTWTISKPCNVTCGEGYLTQQRECNNPAPSNGGLHCTLTGSTQRFHIETKLVACNRGNCAINGNWGAWQFSSCSVSCGVGSRTKTRLCNSPSAQHGGLFCLLSSGNGQRDSRETATETCTNAACPVNGNWGGWGISQSCNVTCGNGHQQMTRQCNSPAPSNGGQFCKLTSSPQLASTETILQTCSRGACAVNGNWGQWSTVSGCSVTCGAGTLRRQRSCNSPSASNGGLACVLSDGSGNRAVTENILQSCQLGNCPVNGNWGAWISGACSVSCGQGTVTKTRQCNNPSANNGGLSCLLSDNSGRRASVETHSDACRPRDCPVNGNWGTWNPGACSVTCGPGGTLEKTRLCNSPAPAGGGSLCLLTNGTRSAKEAKHETCKIVACPVSQGAWGSWTTGTCSVTCGHGTITRVRKCDSPVPSPGGQSCLLSDGSGKRALTESKSTACHTKDCPVAVNGTWGAWVTGSCSVTCGQGMIKRTRRCDSPCPSYGGRPCLLPNGDRAYTQTNLTSSSCHTQECPKVHGNWGQWTQSSCSKTCGQGVITRTRICNNPTPSDEGGLACIKSDGSGTRAAIETTTQVCNLAQCAVNGNWGAWGSGTCSASCGHGTLQKVRLCNSPAPLNGGLSCIKSDGTGGRASQETKSEQCHLKACAVNGNWGSWSTGTCSTSCGHGTLQKVRQCNSPAPSNGGLSCIKSDGTGQRASRETKSEQCHLKACTVNGNWGSWSTGTCSASCGHGTLQKVRQCNSPVPSNGGLACIKSDGTGQRASRETKSEQCHLKACTVNGNWGVWSTGTCSASCGHGTLQKVRQCNSPAPSNGGLACIKSDGTGQRASRETKAESCHLRSCLVDGDWGAWTDGACSVTCGTGFHTRERLCNNPAPLTGGLSCVKSDGTGERSLREIKIDMCNLVPCSVNGNWGQWSSTACSVSCGPGTQDRVRTCNSPAPQSGGLACTLTNSNSRALTERISQSCQLRLCPENGNWGQWGALSSCSVSCGSGTQSRTRLCNSPSPSNGGMSCTLSNGSGVRAVSETITQNCNSGSCPVHGTWGSWLNGHCSSTCGHGTMTRSRLCNSPNPSNGGLSCVLSDGSGKRGHTESKTGHCHLRHCFVNGVWGQWAFSTCSVTCGHGSQTRTRSCNSPSASNGGLSCLLSNGSGQRASTETLSQTCHTQDCAVNGNWGGWSTGTCSVSCGHGIVASTRSCNNPAPSNGGLSCVKSDGSGTRASTESKNEACHTKICPVNGNWGQWEAASSCSVTCGNGVQTRVRHCDSPVASSGGQMCLLSTGSGQRGTTETQSLPCTTAVSCNVRVEGNWAQWSVFSNCDVTCGTGLQSRTRHCSSPVPQNGGSQCVLANGSGLRALHETMTQSCNTNVACVVQGNWGQWTSYSACSVTCGTGLQFRDRHCNSPIPAGGGLACTLTNSNSRATLEKQSQTCTMSACVVAVNGNWGLWTAPTSCSVTCGHGTQSISRSCNSPAPSQNGLSCVVSDGSGNRALTENKAQACHSVDCPAAVNGNWGRWTTSSSCTVTCGQGRQTRVRSCNDPAPLNGGLSCIISSNGQRANREEITVQCIQADCPVDGKWGAWSEPSPCSSTCGEGRQTRIRECDNPPPSSGGLYCLLRSGTKRAVRETWTGVCEVTKCESVGVNGNWGEWRIQASCSVSCGQGTETRVRDCNDPLPSNGGQSCLLSNGQRAVKETITDVCRPGDCPIVAINGNWGAWSATSGCSVTCGRGTQNYLRVCDSPAPSAGGQYCLLNSQGQRAVRETLVQVCNQAACPAAAIDGNWGAWTHSACSATCGHGTRTQVRYCNNPSPSSGGRDCLLSNGMRASTETLQQSCKERDCIVTPTVINGNWGSWGALSACGASCGPGSQSRMRYCDSPPPSNGGLDCMMPNGMRATRETLSSSCQLRACMTTVVVNGNWGQWSDSSCSVTCGSGTRTRTRSCNSPAAGTSGLQCLMSSGDSRSNTETITVSCTLSTCPQQTNYNCRITNRGVLGCDWRILTDGTRIQPNVDIIPWSYGQLSTPTENTGPTGDADNSGWYLFVNSETTKSEAQARIESPGLNAGTYCLRFKYHMWGVNQGMLGVLIYNMNGSLHGSDDKAIPFRVFGDQGNQWVDKAVTLTTQEQFRIHISYWRFNGPLSDGALDDIRLSTGAC